MHRNSFYWLHDEVRKSGLKPFHLTTYRGTRDYLITQTTHVNCYKKQIFPETKLPLAEGFGGINEALRGFVSVNDDFEYFFNTLQLRSRPCQYTDGMFWHLKLTPNKLEQAKNDDLYFWKTIDERPGKRYAIPDYVVECADEEKEDLFVHCHCSRYTFYHMDQSFSRKTFKVFPAMHARQGFTKPVAGFHYDSNLYHPTVKDMKFNY